MRRPSCAQAAAPQRAGTWCGRTGRPRPRRRGRRAAATSRDCAASHEGARAEQQAAPPSAFGFYAATTRCGPMSSVHVSQSLPTRPLRPPAPRPVRPASRSPRAAERAISATTPADGVGQEGLRGQRRPHEPLEMALTCPITTKGVCHRVHDHLHNFCVRWASQRTAKSRKHRREASPPSEHHSQRRVSS